jgi:hypothetical protein
MAIFGFGKVQPSNYFCPKWKLFGFDTATKANTGPVKVWLDEVTNFYAAVCAR